jgi:hydantoinase/carbamoylase family amidase
MPIDEGRIFEDIETIAGFSETAAEVGFSRPTFSPPWRAARDYVIAQAQAAGCKTRIDAAGNVHARHATLAWDQKVWLSGSHIDSVPTGGKFDGVIGIVAPLEVLRSAHLAGRVLPLELVILAEEEGTTFGIGMIGSRLWKAPTPATIDQLRQHRNRRGLDYFQAGLAHGLRLGDLTAETLQPGQYHGLVEIHAEQGPAMWQQGIPLAVVTSIAGRLQFLIELQGQANHAGSTSMQHRQDALVAAAQVILAVAALPAGLSLAAVATVGQIDCQPNAVNVIPGRVRLTVDLRSPDEKDLQPDRVASIACPPGVRGRCELTEQMAPVALDAKLCQRLAGNELPTTTSGALHDAAILAPVVPTAMLFVASRDGISHNPAEFSRIRDIAAAARVLEKLVAES